MLSLSIAHDWLFPDTLADARALQIALAERIVTEDAYGPVRRLGGVDVSNNLRDPESKIYGAVVSLSYPELTVIEQGGSDTVARFPYVPGFLSFREIPALVEAFRQLTVMPDLVLVDGHGITHPRGIGIASHLGVVLDCPTVGVAKSILVGRPEGELGPERGDWVPLVWKGQPRGVALRTRRNVKPVYVSVGHRISLASAIDWVLKAHTGYRLPEPTRQAHLHANVVRRERTLVGRLGAN